MHAQPRPALSPDTTSLFSIKKYAGSPPPSESHSPSHPSHSLPLPLHLSSLPPPLPALLRSRPSLCGATGLPAARRPLARREPRRRRGPRPAVRRHAQRLGPRRLLRIHVAHPWQCLVILHTRARAHAPAHFPRDDKHRPPSGQTDSDRAPPPGLR